MKDPERLIHAGTDEDRRLLRAAREVRVPETVQADVRRAVEARARRSPKGRLLLGGAGLLLVAAAAASSLLGKRPPPPTHLAPHATAHPVVVGLAPPPAPLAPPPAAPPPVRPPAGHREITEARPTPTQLSPGLDLDGFRHGAVETPPVIPAPAPPPPRARLLIARSDRRDVDLEVTATSVRGQVRGRAVALTVTGTALTGRIGDDEVVIHIFARRRAEGTVGGRELDFSFTPTDGGWVVDAALPDVQARVRLESGRLSFRPGCDGDLDAVSDHPGSYRGTCGDETRMRIELPPVFLTPMARLVVLAMLLPEPVPVLRGRVPGLFPPP